MMFAQNNRQGIMPTGPLDLLRPFSLGNTTGAFNMNSAPRMPTVTGNQSFTWGAGGARLTPEQLELRQKAALAQTQPDYSPVQHWTQGLARVANNITGALELRDLDKQAAAAEKDKVSSVAALLAKGDNRSPSEPSPVVQALLSSDPTVQKLAMWRLEQDNPKPVQPHYWESNNGSLFAVGADAQPREIYHDPTPKMNFIPDGMGGGNWVALPSQAPGPVPAASGSSVPAVGSVVADPRLNSGGGAGNGAGSFR
jgi:hypothetical protein